jgi:hypothetical protein
MITTEHNAKPIATPKSGLFATLCGLLHIQGTGAPKSGQGIGAFEVGHRLILAGLATTLGVLAFTTAPALAAGDANAAGCPFETESSPGFRSFLPDCRAYELASPAFGGGQFAGARGATADGEHLLAIAFADIADTENLEQENANELGAMYEFSRTAEGWEAEALDPPASEFPRREFAFASADLERSLWKVQVPSTANEETELVERYDGWTLAIREPAGEGKGRFVLLGPVVAPGHAAVGESPTYFVPGASADLSHVLLEVRSGADQLWAGDGTVEGGQSLYEYDGTSEREPILVGVKNIGPLHGSPYINENATLLSACGTAFDAVSGDGEIVYLAAQHVEGCASSQPSVNEIYARVGRAKTLAISEPPLSTPGRNCTEVCETDETDEADRSDGAFQGESADGEHVFFTSQQPLVNEALGQGDCLYGETVSGEGLEAHLTAIQLLACNVTSVPAVATDGTRVYFTSEKELTSEPNANGEKAAAGSSNLFVAQSGEPGVAYVARETSEVHTTPDGAFAVFASARDLMGTEDTSEVEQLFEYDAITKGVVRVSKGATGAYECPGTHVIEEGYGCDGNTATSQDTPRQPLARPLSPPGQWAGTAMEPTGDSSYLAVAESGVVVFTSPLALTPGAAPARTFGQGNQTENVYEYRDGDVYLISAGDESAPLDSNVPRVLGVDESGRDIYFRSTDGLLAQDTDTQSSWYDAREEGGFPAPLTTAGCFGEACQGPLSEPPLLPSSGGTEATSAGDNAAPLVTSVPVAKPKPAAKCKKGFVKKKNKCVVRHVRGGKKGHRARKGSVRS